MTKRINNAIRIAGLCFLFVLSFVVKAQNNHLLWKIESLNQPPSYLFGTIHLNIDCIYDKYPQIHSLIDSCDRLALELIPDENMAMTILPLIMSEPGKQLEDYMSKKEYSKLKRALEKNLDIDISSFKQYKPIAIFFIIELIQKGEIDNTNDQDSILDFQLMKYASNNNKKLISIETIEEQLNALSVTPIKMLVDQLNNPNKSSDLEQELIQAYCEADLTKINELISKTGDVMMLDELLVKRNKVMADRIKIFSSEDSTFFAVGAGHLTGKEGLIALLKEKGFTVTPVD